MRLVAVPVPVVLAVLGVRVVVLLLAVAVVAVVAVAVAVVALLVVVSIVPFVGSIVRSSSLSPAVAFPSATLLAVAVVCWVLFFLRHASLAAAVVAAAAAAAVAAAVVAVVPVGVGVYLSRTPFHGHVPRLSFSSRPSHPARVLAPVPVCPCH